MQAVLLAPIHLNALCVKEGRRVSQPMADFARLPYFDGTRDDFSSLRALAQGLLKVNGAQKLNFTAN